MLDLNKLEKKLDDSLEKETTESLTDWLIEKRKESEFHGIRCSCDNCSGNGWTYHSENDQCGDVKDCAKFCCSGSTKK